MTRQSSMFRRRAACLIAVHLLFAVHFLHWKLAGRTLAPIEPSEMFDTLHLGVVTVGFLFMAGAVVATAIGGRFFCGWGCHILALQDLCAWLLGKLKVPTKPLRSRTLVWVPPLAVCYLFVWPHVKRMLAGEPLAALHVVTDPDGWTSFSTDDLLRSFPGPWMTAITLGVCGFAIVYFLGSRSFCRYACPYGAIFAAATRIAPLRIVAGPGECSQCGLCMASCKSNVRVIEEVARHGAVVDVNCFRDMDCVSACPTDAIRLGWVNPAAIRQPEEQAPQNKVYDFTPSEDLLMGVVFIATLPVARGLYDAVSFLLALAICSLLALAAVTAIRLAWWERVVCGRYELKLNGSLTRRGWLTAFAMVAVAGLVVQSALVRCEVEAGEWALRRAMAAGALAPAAASADPTVAKLSSHATAQADISAAIEHFQRAGRWGLVQPRSLSLQLAALQLRAGRPARAREELNALLADDPADADARLLLAKAWLADERPAIARQHVEAIIATAADATTTDQRRMVAAAHTLAGDLAANEGQLDEALGHFEAAIELNPRHEEALSGRGAMLAASGKYAAAAETFQTVLDVNPLSAEAHNNLAAMLVRLQRPDESLAHYQRAAELAPQNATALANAGQLHLEAGRLDDAERAFQRSLEIRPEDVAAQAGLAAVRQERERRRATDRGSR